MYKLVGQQAADHEGSGRFKERPLRQAAVVRFMMFEAEVGYMIAEREQEVITAIMPGAEELSRLGHQIRHALLDRRAHLQRSRAVGHHIDLVMHGLTRRREVDR